MFEKLDILLDNRENKLAVQIKNGILKHSSTLESEFNILGAAWFARMRLNMIILEKNSNWKFNNHANIIRITIYPGI